VTIQEAFRAGIRKVRRDPWAKGEWLELIEAGRSPSPFAVMHSSLNTDQVPPEIRIGPQEVAVWTLPQDDGWEPLTEEEA
jgi:hypothetical protein